MKQRVMKEMYLGEISAVDRPAQVGARQVLMKRGPMTKRIALTNAVAGHSHTLITNLEGGEVNRGKTSWMEGHDHDWIMDDAGNILIGDSMGHNHGLAALVMKSLEDGITDESALAALVAKHTASATKAADSGTKESPMTPEEKAAVEKAQNDAKVANEALAKRLARAEKVAELNDAQRTLFSKMAPEKQDEFLALKPEERQAAVTKVAEENPVVETIDGMTFRKNDDPRLLAMAKSARKDRDEREAVQKQLQLEGLRKRAEELKHLPGDVDVRVLLLKAVDTLPADEKAKVEALLKANDAGLAKAFETAGSKGGPKDGTPEAKIEAIAKRIRTENPKLSPEQAMAKALETPEGIAAYSQHVGA